MTPFQQKVTQLLQLSQQYQQLSTGNDDLSIIQDLIQVLEQEQQQWSKNPISPTPEWFKRFESLYTKYDQACCANKLSSKEEKFLKKEMEKAIKAGEKLLQKEGVDNNTSLEEQIAQAKGQLNTLQCANNHIEQEEEEVFIPHVHDDKHFIGGDKDAGNFFSILDGEYTYNKSLSNFLITPEYIESLLHELEPLLDNYKHNLKGAIQEVKNQIKTARKTAKEHKCPVPKKRIAQLKDKIGEMKDKLQLMKEKVKELKKEKKQLEKEIKKDNKALQKEGLIDDIQRHKGNIDGYLDAAYISKFKKAGEDYVANCQKEEPSERVAAYLKESMERLIVQLDQEIKDAECTELITEADKAQMNSIKEQMEKSITTLERDCTFQGLPCYIIEDIQPSTTTDHCGNIITLKATRKVTKIVNPDFKPQTIDYSKIIAATQDSIPILNIADQKGQTALPETALQAEGFDIESINIYFENNPTVSEYTTPLDLETGIMTPMIYTISDGELEPIRGENNWIIGWKATRTIKAELAIDCETMVQWSHIWTAASDDSTTQPTLIKAGSGDALPTDTANHINIRTLYNKFNRQPNTITEYLEWNFPPAPLGIITFVGNKNEFTSKSTQLPTSLIKQWVLFSIANPDTTFNFYGDTSKESDMQVLGENKDAWNYCHEDEPQKYTNEENVNLNQYQIGNQPNSNLLGQRNNVGTLMLWRAGAVAQEFVKQGFPLSRVSLHAGNCGSGKRVRILVK